MPYAIVDLFAGPGGLGEGFSSFLGGKAFKIALSAEMDEYAHRTLLLRSFFRNAKDGRDDDGLAAYYSWCNGESDQDPLEVPKGTFDALEAAKAEALRVTLGKPEDNAKVDASLKNLIKTNEKTILIGGPPCQAYSLVGRSRNKGISDYRPEKDHRHYLYKEYLRIISKIKPAVFVMENVKGIISAKVQGQLIFEEILEDLSAPGKAMAGDPDLRYSLHPLSIPEDLFQDDVGNTRDPHSFIVRSDAYGIPQARHRVIILGVREDIPYDPGFHLEAQKTIPSSRVLDDLPRLRSRLSNDDSPEAWESTISSGIRKIAENARIKGDKELAAALLGHLEQLDSSLETGALRLNRDKRRKPKALPPDWYVDDRLNVILNHSARSHMPSDLVRYFYAATFTELHGKPPKGAGDFSFPGLKPNHKNWESGIFADRFRVQRGEEPSTTITSHISKDGHYFIHPDPLQCRSLTVREAARLQTFPDNYFFQGNRTQQYHQVGNAVPPYLASQIAKIIWNILGESSGKA